MLSIFKKKEVLVSEVTGRTYTSPVFKTELKEDLRVAVEQVLAPCRYSIGTGRYTDYSRIDYKKLYETLKIYEEIL